MDLTNWFIVGSVLGIIAVLAFEAFLVLVFFVRPRLALRYPLRIKPKQIVKTPDEVQQLLHQDEHKKESVEWLNVLLQRLWVENYQTGSIYNKVSVLIKEEIVDLHRNMGILFVKSGKLTDLSIGALAPNFKNILVICKQTKDSDLTCFVDVSYTGGLAFILDLELTIGIPISVMVQVKEVSGRLVFHYTEKGETTWSFAFREDPTLKLYVQTLIFQSDFQILNRLIASQAKAIIRRKLTLPFFKTKWFGNSPPQPPYPWEVEFDEEQMRNWKPPTKEELAEKEAKLNQKNHRKPEEANGHKKETSPKMGRRVFSDPALRPASEERKKPSNQQETLSVSVARPASSSSPSRSSPSHSSTSLSKPKFAVPRPDSVSSTGSKTNKERVAHAEEGSDDDNVDFLDMEDK